MYREKEFRSETMKTMNEQNVSLWNKKIVFKNKRKQRF